MRRTRIGPAAGLFLLAQLPVTLAAQGTDTVTPHLRAGRLSGPLRLDGRLDEPAWATADSIAGLTQVTPVEGGTPASRTVVKVLANDREVVFGILAYGAPGLPITSFNKSRDVDPGDEDYLRIVLDTFRDGRSGYVFSVNPGGARFDGLVVNQGQGIDQNWDAIWEAATVRSGNDWSAEIRIPIRSLIFRTGLNAWGFNIQRQVKANLEVSRWASPAQNIQPTQTSRAGVLDDLPDFRLGLGLSVRPAAVAGGGHPAPGTRFDGTVKPSLDVTQRLGGNLLASLTANTDFAETDADIRRTNFTRFPLFFPEKRSFFLEGTDIFEFGPNLGEDLIPFFSRRIGLLEDATVPLRLGTKLNGRAGSTNFGALVTRTGDGAGVTPAATLGAFRLRQNVGDESSVGVIGTGGDPAGRGGAWTAGGDAIYHTTHFLRGKNLTVGTWAVRTGRDSAAGNGTAYGFLVDFPNDVWDVSASYKRFGNQFDPVLGFVPRRGIKLYRVGIAYQPRPHRWGIRQMFFEQGYTLVTDLEDQWESYEIFLAPVNWRFESGDRIEFNVVPQGERLKDVFEVADGVTIQSGPYNFVRYRLEAEFAARRRVSGQLTWRFGGFYDGRLDQLQVQSSFKPSSSFILEVNAEHDVGRLPNGRFDATLLGLRAMVNVSPDLNLSSFVQYDTDSRTIGTNTRLRWTFDPAGDLFLVYNRNLKDFGSRWRLESDQLLAKVQYTLRY